MKLQAVLCRQPLAYARGSHRSRGRDSALLRQEAVFRTIVTIAGFACVSLVARGQTKHLEPDFRSAVWGMTRADVIGTEPNRPFRVSENDGEIVLQYDASKLGALHCRPIYIFANGKLVRAKFVFAEEHGDPNEFIRDFHTAELGLKETHGTPKEDQAIWEDDSTQQETKSYLDQDRATASSILPSDRFVGLAVALGHLKLYTIREDGRTKVLHVLAGGDHRITHQIEYRAVAQ